ncbi:MAG: hypothetical protein LC808_40980 [Actinobacteria bacterium]|nr:hypothetical protein [Actinomycetota bacterium]
MALAPATASASHFINSTKACDQPGVCVLTIGPLAVNVSEGETITVALDPGATGATFQTATRTGGDCPPTAVSLVDPTTVHLDPSTDLPDGCTIVLEETLAAQSAGEVCQTIDSDFNFPPFEVCAQLTPAQCSDSADNDSDGRTDFPADPGCSSATDNDETDPPPTPPARQCSDGRDNDRDGRTDFPRDPGCSSATDNNESNPPPANPCTITGTSGNDVLRGTSGRDVICAGAGNDIVYGRGGNDVIRGGPGNDVLRGGDGDDRLIGGTGRDVLYGNAGADSLHTEDGTPGNDIARGGAGSDTCRTDRGDVRSSC